MIVRIGTELGLTYLQYDCYVSKTFGTFAGRGKLPNMIGAYQRYVCDFLYSIKNLRDK